MGWGRSNRTGGARLLVGLLVVGLLSAGGVEAAGALGSPVLVSITVSPATANVDVGGTEQFTATGTYSNLTTATITDSVNWSSSADATVSSTGGSRGLATGVSDGAATITATDPSDSLIAGTAVLTVLPDPPPTLVSITVSPAAANVTVGGTQQLTATGTYSDLSTANLTDSVTWSSTADATVSNSAGSQGLATGVSDGAATITATDPSSLIDGTAALTVLPDPPPTLVSITVSPAAASVMVGGGEQFVATGTYSDLSSANLTDSVTWSSTADATVSNSAGSQGVATGVTAGAATITATDPSSLINGTAVLTVTPPALVSITVSPPAADVEAGATQQFTATGTYSDLATANLTDSVTWSSTADATVSNSAGSQGLATGVSDGAATITATDPSSLIDGTAVLTVTPVPLPPPTLVAVTVSPAVADVGVGGTQQFTATGTYSDLTTANLTDSVTWSSTADATVSNSAGSQGLATGVSDGAATITATDPSSLINGTAVLTVTPVTVPLSPPTAPLALAVNPGSAKRKAAIVIHGAGFTSGDPVTVTYLSGLRRPKRASTVLCRTTVAPDGAFTCDGTVPRASRSGRKGTHTVVATDSSGKKVTTGFVLVGHRR